LAWYIPFNKLSDKQRRIIGDASRDLQQNVWIKGFAGTGKTNVLMHLIEKVAADQPAATLCCIAFTNSLKELMRTGLHGEAVRRVEVLTEYEFRRRRRTYDYVFLDEVQDVAGDHLQEIRRYAKHLYCAGDGDQRIYDHGSDDGVIQRTVSPHVFSLLEIFRLTEKLRTIALRILPNASVVEGQVDRNMAEADIRCARFTSAMTEADWVWREASRRGGGSQSERDLAAPTYRHRELRRVRRQSTESAGPTGAAVCSG
jgi:hypothetical protein